MKESLGHLKHGVLFFYIFKGENAMDFTKPIYGEVEGFVDATAAKTYFKSHGIKYTEQVEDGYYVGSFYTFKFPAMTEKQLKEADKHTEVLFYQ